MTLTSSESNGSDGERTTVSAGASPLARFRSHPLPRAGGVEGTVVGDTFTPQNSPPTAKRGGKKNNAGEAGSRKALAGRLIRYSRTLALKYELNLARTFGADEAEEWVRASGGTLMRLPLRNTRQEAAGFYAELALALADERQKERGILAEASLKWAGDASLLVDLRGKK